MTEYATPEVAIVIRTKDRPDMLRRALDSIFGQTFENWAAVIVNDGGDAATIDSLLVEVKERARDRVTVVHHADAKGRWGAANAGVTASDAPLLVLHDDDDSWHPDFLAEATAYLSTHLDDHGALARTEVILEAPADHGFAETGRYLLEDHNPEVLLTDLLEFNRFVPISFVYRRRLHDLVGLYDERLPAAGDWAFNLAVVALRPLPYFSERPLAYWHQRPGVPGTLGNSVHNSTDHHAYADRAFRDDQLRSFVDASGLGLPLYLSAAATRDRAAVRSADAAFIEQLTERLNTVTSSLESVHARLERLEHHLSRTIDTRVRGWVWRQKKRLRR